MPPVSLGRQGGNFSLRPYMSENVFLTLSPGWWFGYNRLLGWKIIFLWILKALFHWFIIPVVTILILDSCFLLESFRIYLFSGHTLDLVFVTPCDLWSLKHATTSVCKLFVFWFLWFFTPTWNNGMDRSAFYQCSKRYESSYLYKYNLRILFDVQVEMSISFIQSLWL